MRREELYLTDIVEAADAIRRFIEDVQRRDFFADELCQQDVPDLRGEVARILVEEHPCD